MPKVTQLTELHRSVAKKVLSETLGVKPGETITIESWTNGLPLAQEVALQAKQIGAYPLVTYEDEESYVKGIRSAPKEALGKMGKHEYGLLANSDAYVFIPGPPIAGFYPRITRKEFIDSTSYNGSWYDAAKKSGLRGARITAGYVGADLARLLGRSKEEIVVHQLRAASVDLSRVKAKARELSGLMKDGAEVSLATDGGEIHMRLKGDLEVQDGVTDAQDVAEGNNMAYVPPGYIAKDVEAGSVEGSIKVTGSITRFGMVEDAELRFMKGAFAGWSSRKSAGVLMSLQDVLPETARAPTFLLVGLNPLMKFGFAQDRFPEGAVTVGVGFSGTVRKGTLTVDGKTVVREGRLA